MIPLPAAFTDLTLLFLRLMIAIVFVVSGWNHLKDPAGRAASIGMSKGFTVFIGAAELLGGLGVGFGVLTQFAALGLTLVMFGAIQKKMVVWRTGFWGTNASGWHYDLLFVAMNLVVIATGGGRWTLERVLFGA